MEQSLGYEYFNETNTTPSTAELSKETVIVGGEQFKILQVDPTSGTTRLQKVLSGLEVGKTYRVAVILPRTTYNVVHNGTTYPVQNTRLEDKALQVTMPNGVGIGMKDAYYAVAIPNYTFPANSKAGRGLTPDGNYHYWISFVATAPTATVTYLGASNNVSPTASSSTPGGFRLMNAGGRQISGFTLHQKIPTEEDGEEDGYRYGFNTQQKQDDIYGPGNQTTALYWEYDTRLGRRWNLDPVLYVSLSRYSTFGNNPLNLTDHYGDKLKIVDPNDKLAREDILSVAKEENKKFITFDADGYVNLDFGDLSQKKIDKILKRDKGLATLNKMINAKKEDGSDYMFAYGTYAKDFPIHDREKGTDRLFNFPYSDIKPRERSTDPNNPYFFSNLSTTEYRPQPSFRPARPRNGWDGAVFIAKGKLVREEPRIDGFGRPDVTVTLIPRNRFVLHELQENAYRTIDKMYYDEAHFKSEKDTDYTYFEFK